MSRQPGHETGAGPQSRGAGGPVTTGTRPLFSAAVRPTPPRKDVVAPRQREIRAVGRSGEEIGQVTAERGELLVYNRENPEGWIQGDCAEVHR